MIESFERYKEEIQEELQPAVDQCEDRNELTSCLEVLVRRWGIRLHNEKLTTEEDIKAMIAEVVDASPNDKLSNNKDELCEFIWSQFAITRKIRALTTQDIPKLDQLRDQLGELVVTITTDWTDHSLPVPPEPVVKVIEGITFAIWGLDEQLHDLQREDEAAWRASKHREEGESEVYENTNYRIRGLKK